MGRARGDKEYILPVKGLNTEANLLHFPNEFSPNVLNFEPDYNPQMVRVRKGLAESGSPQLVDTRNASDHDVAITSFLWEGAGGDPDLDLIVVQVAEFLFFFDVADISTPSTAIHTEKYDLSKALSGTSKGTQALLEPTRVVMTNVKGKLLVTCEQIDPVILTWDPVSSVLSPVLLTLKIRDVLGIEDGLEIDEHPSTLTDDHKYNLYNQGWGKQRRLTAGSSTESDPIANYNTVNSEYPSNADVVWVGMIEESGDLLFDAEWLNDQTFGSSPAARGHYIVDAFNIDRATVLSTPLVSGMSSGGSHARRVLGDLVGRGTLSVMTAV